MKKASYRLLQWTMLMGTAAIMATACVVTSGDGDNDGEGGEGGTTSSAGKTSTEAGKGGSGGKAGSGSGGTSTAGSATAGSTSGGTGGGTGGSGGSAPAYVPGLCEGDAPEPTSLPSCSPAANDEGQTCKICLKAQCCTEWKTCYGDTPTSACGWGKTEEAPGQFDCIQACYLDGLATATDLSELQQDCAGECLNQCEGLEADMDFITTITQDVMICANDKCLDECFPAE